MATSSANFPNRSFTYRPRPRPVAALATVTANASAVGFETVHDALAHDAETVAPPVTAVTPALEECRMNEPGPIGRMIRGHRARQDETRQRATTRRIERVPRSGYAVNDPAEVARLVDWHIADGDHGLDA